MWMCWRSVGVRVRSSVGWPTALGGPYVYGRWSWEALGEVRERPWASSRKVQRPRVLSGAQREPSQERADRI